MDEKYVPIIKIKVYKGPVNFLNVQHKTPARVLYVWTVDQLNQALNSLCDGETFLLTAWFVSVHYYPNHSTLDLVEGPYEGGLHRGNLSVSKASDLLKDYDKEPMFDKPIRKNRTQITFS